VTAPVAAVWDRLVAEARALGVTVAADHCEGRPAIVLRVGAWVEYDVEEDEIEIVDEVSRSPLGDSDTIAHLVEVV
jgi:hypothetical protein